MIVIEEFVDFCPSCGDKLQEGCCDNCDDQYAANDNYEETAIIS